MTVELILLQLNTTSILQLYKSMYNMYSKFKISLRDIISTEIWLLCGKKDPV